MAPPPPGAFVERAKSDETQTSTKRRQSCRWFKRGKVYSYTRFENCTRSVWRGVTSAVMTSILILPLRRPETGVLCRVLNISRMVLAPLKWIDWASAAAGRAQTRAPNNARTTAVFGFIVDDWQPAGRPATGFYTGVADYARLPRTWLTTGLRPRFRRSIVRAENHTLEAETYLEGARAKRLGL